MSRARWCDDCQRYHPAKNGQGWLFSTGGMFATRKFYVAEYDQVRCKIVSPLPSSSTAT